VALFSTQENDMSASYSALQLGLLLWKVKMCQDSVWSDRPATPYKGIHEIDALLDEIKLVLPALADRINRQCEKEFEPLLRRMEKRHRVIRDMNIEHFCSLMDTEEDQRRRRVLYQGYLADETNHTFREWQKADRRNLQELLATVVATDRRLRGYYQIGSRFGEALDEVKRASGTLTKSAMAYILGGMKQLPLREQNEIEPFFMPMSLDLVLLGKQIKTLGRFLRSHEDQLVAMPKWDGKTITYREKSEEIKIQDNGVIGIILGEGEKQKWADSLKIPKVMSIRDKGRIKEMVIERKSITNAIGHFHREHELLEFSLNGDRLIWGPPGTVIQKARGIAKRKARKKRT
jgi:hypothetical protein